jgi:crossover junction endodeoxyribonuclease RuvC
MGYGLVWCSGSRLTLVEMGVLKLPARKDAFERLGIIHKKIGDLITQFRPHDFAIEAPFFGKNVQSMLKLGRAQGVAIATAMHAGLPVTEYSPRKIKQSITGNGNSAKEQVWKMLQHILQLEKEIRDYDASDALAVAVCHHFQQQFARASVNGEGGPAAASAGGTGGTAAKTSAKRSATWENFVQQNPGKIRTR